MSGAVLPFFPKLEWRAVGQLKLYCAYYEISMIKRIIGGGFEECSGCGLSH